MIADPATLIQRQDKVPYAIGATPLAMAAGDRSLPVNMLCLARDAIDWRRRLTLETFELSDVGTEALLLAGEAGQARQTADAMEDRRSMRLALTP